MKESIAGVPIFQIVIVFIIIFAGIMALTINHSKAFGVKDEIINIIESSNDYKVGLSEKTLAEIANRLGEVGYRASESCSRLGGTGWRGYTRDGVPTSGDAAFCIRVSDAALAMQQAAANSCNCSIVGGDFPEMTYYDIGLFYKLEIPILNDLLVFTLKGSTKIISE